MRVMCSVVLCCISLWILSSEAARWSDWQELTKCNAKPCNCNVTKRTKCEQGEIIKLRFCIHEEGDTQGCLWDKEGGAMKKEKCTNDGTNCPGWSDWQLGECDCKSNIRLDRRDCSNPPPIHNDVLCKSGPNEDAMYEEQTTVCNCTEEEMATTPTTTTTTTTTGASTTPLPCCKKDAHDSKSNDNEDNGNVVFGGSATEATTTKKPSQVDLDYYAMYDDLLKDNPNCRNCSQAEIEAERGNADNGNGMDYGDYGNYGNYGNYDEDGEDGGDQGDGGDGGDSDYGDY